MRAISNSTKQECKSLALNAISSIEPIIKLTGALEDFGIALRDSNYLITTGVIMAQRRLEALIDHWTNFANPEPQTHRWARPGSSILGKMANI